MLKELGKIAVFIICAQTLMHFRAKESYEKYIKLLISMMLLLLLLKPFFSTLSGAGEDMVAGLVAEYEQKLGAEALGDLRQAEVEAVVMSMANEMIVQEQMQTASEVQEWNGTAGKEENAEAMGSILVETIQIGE